MVNIALYQSMAEPRRVYKQDYIEMPSEFNDEPIPGILKDDCDMSNPVVLIETSENIIELAVNYAYIDIFHRWYFVTKIEIVRTNLYRIYMHVDVLMSFVAPKFSGVPTMKVVVGRSESFDLWNKTLLDSRYPIAAEKELITIDEDVGPYETSEFSDNWDTDWCYVLTVPGTTKGTVIP